MLYRVNWRDGTTTECVNYEESMRLIDAKPDQWESVQPMEYGKDLDPQNIVRRKAWRM
jgi:hypothetical protein